MPINSRQKGAAGERELANLLTKSGFVARRGQQFSGSPDSPDVVCESIKELGFLIECKRVQALNIHKAMTKAEDDAGDLDAVVMHRKNGEEWLATVRLDVFLLMLDKFQDQYIYKRD